MKLVTYRKTAARKGTKKEYTTPLRQIMCWLVSDDLEVLFSSVFHVSAGCLSIGEANYYSDMVVNASRGHHGIYTAHQLPVDRIYRAIRTTTKHTPWASKKRRVTRGMFISTVRNFFSRARSLKVRTLLVLPPLMSEQRGARLFFGWRYRPGLATLDGLLK